MITIVIDGSCMNKERLLKSNHLLECFFSCNALILLLSAHWRLKHCSKLDEGDLTLTLDQIQAIAEHDPN